MAQNILIAGAGGYIGSKAVDFFLENGFTVVALDRYYFGDVFKDLESNTKLKVIKEDIRSVDISLLKGVDYVINFASISNDPASELNPQLTLDINFEGAVTLAKKCRIAKVKKYIFASSCSVYGGSGKIATEKSSPEPLSEYARSKILAEKSIAKLNNKEFTVTILRLATVYGLSKRRMRFDLIVNIMTLYAWKNKKIFITGGGKQWRPLVHIDDVIKAFYFIIKEQDNKKIADQIFNVGSNDHVYQVFQVANKFLTIFPDVVLEEVPEDPDARSYRVNFDKIHKVLNYSVDHSVEESINEIRDSLIRGEITNDIRTNTLQYYKYLLDADALLSKIKLKGKLF